MTECPRCSQPVNAGFGFCPYCSAPLGAAPPDLPEVLPAEREGRRDLGRVGVGLIVLGMLGFVGVILFIGSGTRFDPQGMLIVGGGAILMVVAGSAIAASRRGGSAAAGLLGGCASALMGVVLGGVLVTAMLVYALSDCLKTCNGQQPAAQQKR